MFKPKIHYAEFDCISENSNIKNSKVHLLAKELVEKAYPNYQDKSEKRWEYFYLPLQRRAKLISLPFGISEYERKFYVYFNIFPRKNLEIDKGNREIEKLHEKIFEDALRFSRIINKTNGKIIDETYPYDLRTGQIKGKYVMKSTMPKKKSEEILGSYKKLIETDLKVYEISLNDYLRTAGICYKAAFGTKTENLSDERLYRGFADGRDCGMLKIKDKHSKEAFNDWLKNESHCGGHPFEIVFSQLEHGIHLFPPNRENPYFSLRVTDYTYTESFIKMVESLIRSNIPFRASHIEEVLDYLTGGSYFRVNDYSDNMFDAFFYSHSKEDRKYFKHIMWDEIKIVKLKPDL